MEATMLLFRILLLSLLVTANALAQHDMSSHDGAKPISLESGLGKVHWPVSTKNAEAQKFFHQGMEYLYGFNHESAVRSFQRATELDPDLVMGYWGAALALGPNINLDVDPDREKQAYEGVRAALTHTSHASAKERDLVDALAKRYSNDPKADLKKLGADYSAAMGEVSKKYPADLDIATLYAESMMDLHPGSSGRTMASRTKGRIRSSPSSNPFSAATPITSARTTTTSTRSRRRRIPSALSPAPSVFKRWLRRPVISSTCPRTSTSAPATTQAPRSRTRRPAKPIAISSRRTAARASTR
jgi:hypothetical protein